MRISIADTFLDALRALDPVDARRASAFAEKLVLAPEIGRMRPEIVHEARDRAVRSMRVTKDMRTIAHLAGERLLLLFVSRHDAAYAWARDHCIECIVTGEEVRVRVSEIDETGTPELEPIVDCRACVVETLDELRALFSEYGVPLAQN
ncbi:MAG: hypothetical protein HGB10_09990 [Coriobacteriia bacterium]|nr:hypothetical protein [Coriobacteriia bacterium]